MIGPTAPSAPPPDATLAGYRLIEEVARGGMGEIWRGEHPDTGHPVAIKRLTPAVLELDARGAADEYRNRLLREAAVLRDLTHPNIVRCLDAGHDGDGRPFVVLEWLEGEDLADRQARRPLSIDAIVEVARQALAGLVACHARGLVHRDIKPPNIFLSPTAGEPGFEVKLLDFGVALPSSEATRLTQLGAIVGTLHYLSPEQARGEPLIDHRTDLYSLGVLLYELLTGRVPFSAQQPAAVLFKIVAEIPTPPCLIDERVPPALEALVLRAMSRAAGDRFQSAEEMAAAVEALADLEGTGRAPTIAAAPPAPVERRLVSLLCIEPPAGVADAEPRVRDLVSELGGTAKRLADGKLVVAFGLEQTSGDEPLRCVRAGLRVRQLLGAEVKIEAAAAHVESGGGGVRIDTGDLDRTLHLLPRLPVGELIIDPSTRQQLGDQVTVSRSGELFSVSSLELERAGRRAVLGARPPTVGRDAELAALRARVEGVIEAEEPDAAVVHGPPGMGKSRMLQELLPELRQRSALCLEARPDSSRAGTPYSLLAEALRREAGIQAGQPEADSREALQAAVWRIAPALAQAGPEPIWFLGEALGLPFEDQPALRVARADPKVMRQQVLQAFEALFAAAGAQGLITLCLDDLQWGDEESLQICEHLLERLEQTPLFVLACCRPELLERRPELFAEVEALHLQARPLGKRSLRKLVEAILGGAVPRDVERLIREQWSGNPFFAEELVSWMVSGGVLARHPQGGWELQGDPSALHIPATLQAAIQQRLDYLPAELKDLVKASAVFGVELWEDGCVALGFTDAAARLRGLEQAAFVEPVATSRFADARQWRFKHGLLQQAAYEMLLHDQRAELHLRVGAWLEAAGEPDAAVLGRHFALGGETARAADCFARAGARSLADGELEGAVRFYEQSLEGQPEPDDRAARTLELTRALYLLGNGERGLTAVRELLEAGLQGEPLSRARWLEGRLLFSTAQYDSAERALLEARGALPHPDESGLAFEIDQTLFWVTFARGRYDEATALAEQIHAAAQQGERPEQLCIAKLAVAYSNVVAGDLSVAVSLAQDAVELAREVRHPYREVDSLLLLGSSLETAGLYDTALEHLDAAHALAVQLKMVHQQASSEASRGRVHLLRGEQAEALERYREAARLAGELGDDRVLADGLLGQARALASSPEQAEALACRALMTAEGRAPAAEAEAHAVLASLELLRGRVDEAVERALAATALVERLGGQEQCETEILLVAHDALAAAGRDEEAHAVLSQAQEGIERKATSISDEGVRRAFVEQVPHHVRARRLVEEQG